MKIIIFIFLFITSFANSQIVSVGVDISNAIQGSKVNRPSLDIQVRIADLTKHREIGIEFENFSEIKYFSWGMYFNHVIRIPKIELAIGMEGIQIIRGSFVSYAYGFNIEPRFCINDKFALSYQFNYRRRTDLQMLYNDGRFVESGFVKIIYRWR